MPPTLRTEDGSLIQTIGEHGQTAGKFITPLGAFVCVSRHCDSRYLELSYPSVSNVGKEIYFLYNKYATITSIRLIMKFRYFKQTGHFFKP